MGKLTSARHHTRRYRFPHFTGLSCCLIKLMYQRGAEKFEGQGRIFLQSKVPLTRKVYGNL
jgi:hypothetical protein